LHCARIGISGIVVGVWTWDHLAGPVHRAPTVLEHGPR